MNCTQFEKTDPTKRAKRRSRPVFDLAQSSAMIPLVNSILKEIVERSVKMSHHELTIKRENAQSAKSARLRTLFTVRDFSETEQRQQNEATDELKRLGVTVLDRVRGVVGFPTIVNGGLAYFLFELGSSEMSHWRYRDESRARPVPVEWRLATRRAALASLEI